MKTATGKGTSKWIAPQCDRRATIHRLTSNVGGRYGSFFEASWNSAEWGRAGRIDISIRNDGKNHEVVIVDNGIGMNHDRMSRFLSLGVAADDSHRGRNYQDIGAKRMGHDFAKCEIWTVCAEDKGQGNPSCWHVTFDWDDLFSILSGDSSKMIEAVPEITDAKLWKQFGLPAGSTGTVIKLSGLRPGRQRFTTEAVVKKLSEELPLSVAGKVFVNGAPLPKREIIGVPYRFEGNHPSLGRVRVDLYVPKVQSTRDILRIGPFEAVTTWSGFLGEIPENLDLDRFAILSFGVCGDIFVEGLGRFVASSRREFDSSLFSEHNQTLVAFLDWLANEVVPPVQKLVGAVRDEETEEHDKRFTEQLREMIKKLGPGTRNTFPVLELDVSSLETLPGGIFTINVTKFDPDKRIVWNTASSGGKTEFSDNNRRVRYTAGKELGPFSLSCYYREMPERQVRIDIEIVSRHVLRIDPPRVTVSPGRQVKLRAVNFEHDSSGPDNLRWRLDRQDRDGHFLVSVGGNLQSREIGFGPEVIYQAGNVEGSFTIELFDQKAHRKTAQAAVTVARPKDRQSKPGNDDIDIEGVPYELRPVRMSGSPILTRVQRLGRRRQIIFNLAHPVSERIAKSLGDESLVVQMANRVLIHHLGLRALESGEDLNPETLPDQHTSLLLKMIEGIPKSKQ